MHFTSVLLTLSAIALVHADMYDTCFAEYTTLIQTTGFPPRTIASMFTGSGDCQGCPFQCMAGAYSFQAANPSRPVVAHGAYNELMHKCTGKGL
ncbi:hypothetical protein Q9L58_002284 [Maublancomyces gigas]|uniref:Uncharacterized protein n=1 Tax=Discina gigas TaxID=1032678 RepID=A0ABR3GRZ1_9PEZI